MEQEYDVFCQGKPAGKVKVRQEGLYTCFDCHCNNPTGDLCRLGLICGQQRENLGVLLPEGGAFALHTRLATSRLGAGEWSFQLIFREEQATFVPIHPDAPFPRLQDLPKAVLAFRDGQAGAVFTD